MPKTIDIKNFKFKVAGGKIVAIVMAACFVIPGTMQGNIITASADVKELAAAGYCTFIVPEGFHPCEVSGLYINEHYPLESANISYSVTEIPQDKVLTNAEKAAGEDPSATEDELLYDELTQEMYEDIQSENYKELYGENVNYTVTAFDEYLIDDYPGYKISASFTPEGSQTIYQNACIILSSNKVFTVVYSRAEDDDFSEAFDESIETIHVRN